MGNFRRVGAFHFGDPDKSCPARSLESVLEMESDLQNSLIVLPEGFNVSDGYYGGTGPTPSIRQKLIALSRKHQIAFVAGLIEESVAGVSAKGFNSAYLVDGDVVRLLSHKRKDYAEKICSSKPGGCREPICYKGLGIASLICTDFINCGEEDRSALINHSGWAGCRMKLLCVPAYSTHKAELPYAAEQWGRKVHIAVANGTDAANSLVRIDGQEVAKSDGNEYFGYQRNQLLMAALPDL
jgi:hypothetical protein